MNADHFKGKWNQFKGELKKKWDGFTDDDLMKSEGDYDKFRRAVQKRYADRKDEVRRWADELRLAGCALALVVSGIPMLFPQHAAAADNELFQQMDIGLFSVGGRAAYYDPQEGQSGWFGGGQVRLHPWKYLAFEGSADYRSEDTAGSRIHTYPVQVSALIYPLGHTRLAPFLLGGGGWYYTTVKGPGNFDDTQNRFGLHAGGGLQFFFTNHISIDSTYRYIWLEDIQSKDQNLQDKSFNDNGHMITVGLNLHF